MLWFDFSMIFLTFVVNFELVNWEMEWGYYDFNSVGITGGLSGHGCS